jgi:hypothetical protein
MDKRYDVIIIGSGAGGGTLLGYDDFDFLQVLRHRGGIGDDRRQRGKTRQR